MPHGLPVREAQHLRPFVLAAADGLDAPAENLREVRRVVRHEGDDGRGEIVDLYGHTGNHGQAVVNEENLEHERRAPHDVDVKFRDAPQKAEPGEAHQREQHAARKGQDVDDDENLRRYAEPFHHVRQDADDVIEHGNLLS